MTQLNTLPNGYTISPYQPNKFFEMNPFFSFTFTNLTFLQILELKTFTNKIALISFKNYGYNNEKKAGSGTLLISKLKKWSDKEVTEFEEIVGSGMGYFWSFLQ